MNNTIKNIVVIGAGAMGSQIAMMAAHSGFHTTMVDLAQEQLDKALGQLRGRLDRDVSKGRRTEKEVASAFSRLTVSTDQAGAVSTADLVIEAAVEDIEIKRSIFAELDRAAPDHTILATNSSNIVSSQIATATGRPDKVCNMHFFNPALVMQAVEVVPNPQTSQETIDAVCQVVDDMGKSLVLLKKEAPGFVANQIVHAIRNIALEMYEDGLADFQAIDVAARTALNHPMGPFELMDLVGIDVAYRVRMAEYEQTGNKASLPHPMLTEKFEAGHLGRKSGRGWYTYS